MLQGNTICFNFPAMLITACSAARLATSLGIVPRATVGEEEEEVEDTVEDTVEEDMVEEEAVEEAEVRWISSSKGLLSPLSVLRLSEPNPRSTLGQTCYSCGGYGHMSRDCTQGQKCYNCMLHPPWRHLSALTDRNRW